MEQFGLESIDGNLIPQEAIEQPILELGESFIRFPLESVLKCEEEIEIKKKLGQILGDNL